MNATQRFSVWQLNLHALVNFVITGCETVQKVDIIKL